MRHAGQYKERILQRRRKHLLQVVLFPVSDGVLFIFQFPAMTAFLSCLFIFSISFPIKIGQVTAHPNCYYSFSIRQAIPGNSNPSINSKDAPPPVEICDICFANPSFSTAAAESPPPMME